MTTKDSALIKNTDALLRSDSNKNRRLSSVAGEVARAALHDVQFMQEKTHKSIVSLEGTIMDLRHGLDKLERENNYLKVELAKSNELKTLFSAMLGAILNDKFIGNCNWKDILQYNDQPF